MQTPDDDVNRLLRYTLDMDDETPLRPNRQRGKRRLLAPARVLCMVISVMMILGVMTAAVSLAIGVSLVHRALNPPMRVLSYTTRAPTVTLKPFQVTVPVDVELEIRSMLNGAFYGLWYNVMAENVDDGDHFSNRMIGWASTPGGEVYNVSRGTNTYNVTVIVTALPAPEDATPLLAHWNRHGTLEIALVRGRVRQSMNVGGKSLTRATKAEDIRIEIGRVDLEDELLRRGDE